MYRTNNPQTIVYACMFCRICSKNLVQKILSSYFAKLLEAKFQHAICACNPLPFVAYTRDDHCQKLELSHPLQGVASIFKVSSSSLPELINHHGSSVKLINKNIPCAWQSEPWAQGYWCQFLYPFPINLK